MSAETDRWSEIRKLHIEEADTYRILGGVILVLVGIWIGSVIFAADNGYSTNLYTEFISIAVTVFVIDFLNRRREARRREDELKKRLLREVRSPEKAVVRHALHELREHGWLQGYDGILRGANLAGANLREAHLFLANLQRADLYDANLQGAHLGFADLQGAHLEFANLQEANLTEANLKGVDLYEANLKGADLRATYLDETTALPDGSITGFNGRKPQYTPDSYYKVGVTDMSRYTDPNHPDFWQPEELTEKNSAEGSESSEPVIGNPDQ